MVEVSSQTLVRRIELPGSRIEDEMVFFSQDAGKYFATGPVGADIWEFLEAPHTFASICEHLLSLYDIDRSTCERHVSAFVAQMEAAGLVSLEAK